MGGVSVLPDPNVVATPMCLNPTPGTWPATPETKSLSSQSGEADSNGGARIADNAAIPRELEFVACSLPE